MAKVVRSVTPDEVKARLDAVRAHAIKLPASNGKSATVGFCWGGGHSFAYAAHQPELNAAVVYYGTSPDAAALASIKAPVLGLYGGADARVNATIPPAKAEMEKLGKTYEGAHLRRRRTRVPATTGRTGGGESEGQPRGLAADPGVHTQTRVVARLVTMIKCRLASTIRASLVLAGVIVAQSLGSSASAQIELAAINGTVTDESGKPLQGVTVTLKDLDRGRETKIKSDKDGKFYRRGFPAVDYEFTVQLEGYQPLTNKLRLTAGTDQHFDFKLAKMAPPGAAEFQKGVKAFNTGDAQTAILAFEDAVKKAPDLPEVRVNLALAYLRASRTDDAIAQLEKAAAMAPDQPHILVRLGGAYVEARKNDRAIEALEKGLAGLPDLADPLAYDATVTLGAVYFAVGQNEQAIARFEKALAAKPGAAAPTLGLGKAFFSKGEVDKALKHFEAVVASAPGTPEAAQAEAFIKELKKSKTPEPEA